MICLRMATMFLSGRMSGQFATRLKMVFSGPVIGKSSWVRLLADPLGSYASRADIAGERSIWIKRIPKLRLVGIRGFERILNPRTDLGAVGVWALRAADSRGFGLRRLRSRIDSRLGLSVQIVDGSLDMGLHRDGIAPGVERGERLGALDRLAFQ